MAKASNAQVKAAIRGPESSGNDRASNQLGSSASGRYQFTEGTFKTYYSRVFGGNAASAWASKRFDPAVQERLMDALIDDNRSTLRGLGKPETVGNLYALHVLGSGDGARFFKAPPGTPVSSIMSAKAIRQNPTYFPKGISVEQSLAVIASKVGGPKVKAGATYVAREIAPTSKLSDFNVDDLLTQSPNTLRDIAPKIAKPTPKPNKVEKQTAHIAGLTGGVGVIAKGPLDTTPDISAEQATQAASTQTQATNEKITFGDRLEASFEDTNLLPAFIRALDESSAPADPTWGKKYIDGFQAIEAFAENQDEVDQLRESTSADSLFEIQQRIEAKRERTKIINSNGTGTYFQVGTSLLDPIGLAAGVGVGKSVQVVGAGSSALAASGRTGAAVLSSGVEGAAGNLAILGALDVAGERVSKEDYAINGLLGLGMGLAISPLAIIGVKSDKSVADAIEIQRKEQAGFEAEYKAEATARLGPQAAPEAIDVEAARVRTTKAQSMLELSLADIPDDARVLSEATLLKTNDPKVLEAVTSTHALDRVSDDAERGILAEMFVRADAFDKANPIDKKSLRTVLKLVDMETTGNTLLSSTSSLARMAGQVLLEGAVGAGGRRRTAAMSQVIRERLYNRPMVEYDALHTAFRKGEGGGLVEDGLNGTYRKQFDDRVFYETVTRGDLSYIKDTNAAVVKAADNVGFGMNMMRVDQQYVDTIGSARLGNDSAGYLPQKADAKAMMALTPVQQRRVRTILSSQFVDPQNGFDKVFSDKLATAYLEKAIRRGQGAYDVPMNLHSPEAADIVRDVLEAMAKGNKDIDVASLMGKYSRGGAGHTKRRLKLNMAEDIGDGMRLGDLFNKDITALYRGYARRVSGEVALMQYGIAGKKGLDLMREGIRLQSQNYRDLEAFDQIASELLNIPFGNHNHKYMDNVMIGTSAARLGGMGFTQGGEYSNGIAALGVQRVFTAIKDIPRLAQEVRALAKGQEVDNPMLNSLEQLTGHFGVDGYSLTRMFDVPDNGIQLYGSENLGVASRALRAGAHAQVVLSGQRVITAVQTRGMAEQIMAKTMAFVRSGADDIHLDDMGISPEIRARLRANLDNIEIKDASGATRLDLFAGDLTGPELNELSQAVWRGAGQIIQRTYAGETGKWAHNGFLRLLFQFRTFSLTSIEKQWGRGIRVGGGGAMGAVKASATLIGAMSFALPIHFARVQSKMIGMSDEEQKEYADRYLTTGAMVRATMNYASKGGMLSDIIDVGSGFASSFGGDTGEAIALQAGGRGAEYRVGGAGQIVPGIGLLEDINKGVHGDWKKLGKIMPGSNLPGVQQIINGVTAE